MGLAAVENSFLPPLLLLLLLSRHRERRSTHEPTSCQPLSLITHSTH
jgi:hypothetical protein